jgi:mannose-6-phosphate isomerase-like protein (cupin superfamily)
VIETIEHDGSILAYLARAAPHPEQTRFLTPPECTLQVGHIVYPAGGAIARHMHLPVERHLVGTTEVLIVQQGRCEVDIYAQDRHLVTSCELGPGDILIAVGGGHGFRILEDVVLLEIKQGPYPSPPAADKERF